MEKVGWKEWLNLWTKQVSRSQLQHQ